MPAGDGDEADGLGVVADLLDEGRRLLDNFVEAVLAPLQSVLETRILMARTSGYANLGSVHLVDGDDELPDTEGEGKEGVLASLAVLGDTGLELTSTGGNDEDSAVGLGGTSNHVLDEVTVTGGIDDLHNKRLADLADTTRRRIYSR